MSFLNKLQVKEQEIVETYLQPVRFSENACIVREGNPGNGCYLIDKGEVRLEVQKGDTATVDDLEYLEAGMFLGEFSLLDGRSWSASAYAQSDVVARWFPKADFETLCERHPRIGLTISQALGQNLNGKLRHHKNFIVPSVSEQEVLWDGWPLEDNLHGDEFDIQARIRMVKGGRLLLPVLNKYASKLGPKILEIGPFFNPLTSHLNTLNDHNVTFWEGDNSACRWLKNHTLPNFHPILCDIRSIDTTVDKTRKLFERLKLGEVRFTSIIISQVLNYINYKELLSHLFPLLESSGYLFINNVAHYGLPKFFDINRPDSLEETLTSVEQLGFHTVEKFELAPPNPPKHNNPRLILVSQKEDRHEPM